MIKSIFLDMSLRIDQRRFFLDTYRTRMRDSTTSNEQADCEERVGKIFESFLHQQKALGLQ